MENFKQIAEDCLAGKLSGTFVLRNGKVFNSKMHLSATTSHVYPYYIAGRYYSVEGNCYSRGLGESDNDIVNFIPGMKKEQIIIDIPEGMEAVQETVDGEIRIKFIEKKLTYCDIEDSLFDRREAVSVSGSNNGSTTFYKKVEVLRKLTNIRNYFGRPDGTENGFYIYKFDENEFNVATAYPAIYASDVVAFAKREHAQAAIDMLGDELKYLFEPG